MKSWISLHILTWVMIRCIVYQSLNKIYYQKKVKNEKPNFEFEPSQCLNRCQLRKGH